MNDKKERLEIMRRMDRLTARENAGGNVTAELLECGRLLDAIGKRKKRMNLMDADVVLPIVDDVEAARTAESQLRREWRDIAVENGINARTYDYRVLKGLSYRDAALTPLHSFPRNEYWERAKENGISKATYWNRLHRGWSKERACSAPLRNTQPKKKRGAKV